MSPRKKVLLVDDDSDFVDINKAVLEENGYEVAVAYSGKECLEKVEADKPDLIVLDVMMATVSEGFDVSRQLRNCEHTKTIPLLILTSINDTVPFKYEPDETWLPADALLEKPVPQQHLLDEVDQRLRG